MDCFASLAMTTERPTPLTAGSSRMKIPTLPFTVTDWSEVAATKHPGETGEALWRTRNIGDLRVRMVEYSPGYLAEHWSSTKAGAQLFIVDLSSNRLIASESEASHLAARRKNGLLRCARNDGE